MKTGVSTRGNSSDVNICNFKFVSAIGHFFVRTQYINYFPGQVQ